MNITECRYMCNCVNADSLNMLLISISPIIQ